MGREQKYQRRTRHLYALLFESGQAYIGQTVDLPRRERQHRNTWPMPFVFRELGAVVGTQREGEDHEYAWRYVAWRAGWSVVAMSRAGTVFTLRDPRRRMTMARYRVASQCQWPVRSARRRRRWSWMLRWLGWQAAALASVIMLLHQPLP